MVNNDDIDLIEDDDNILDDSDNASDEDDNDGSKLLDYLDKDKCFLKVYLINKKTGGHKFLISRTTPTSIEELAELIYEVGETEPQFFFIVVYQRNRTGKTKYIDKRLYDGELKIKPRLAEKQNNNIAGDNLPVLVNSNRDKEFDIGFKIADLVTKSNAQVQDANQKIMSEMQINFASTINKLIESNQSLMYELKRQNDTIQKRNDELTKALWQKQLIEEGERKEKDNAFDIGSLLGTVKDAVSLAGDLKNTFGNMNTPNTNQSIDYNR